MKKSIKIILPILIISLLLPILVNDVQQASARPYYGSVDFSGTVTLKTSEDEISGVTVKLFEDGEVKRTDTTDSNGDYSFTWTVVELRIYTIRIEKAGYRDQFKLPLIRSSECVVNFEIDGRVAMFLWAPDVANQSIMSELGNQLIYDESFTDILYYENQTNWQAAIDAVDALETSDSLVFIYIIGHGENEYEGTNDYNSTIFD